MIFSQANIIILLVAQSSPVPLWFPADSDVQLPDAVHVHSTSPEPTSECLFKSLQNSHV